MRCYFLRNGHIHAVELLTDVSDKAAVEQAREPFEKRNGEFEAFEIWDRTRFVHRYRLKS